MCFRMKPLFCAALLGVIAGTAAAALPYIARVWAWNISDTGAGLTVEIGPLDEATDVYFVYGTDAYLGSGMRTVQERYNPREIGFQANATLSGLTPGTTYYFKAVTSSLAGNIESNVGKFTTTGNVAPRITRATSWNITDSGAGLSADVVAVGLATDVYFVYGTTPELSDGTRIGQSRNGPATAAFQAQATISGLQPKTTYYYKAVVHTLAGSAESSVGTFTTPDKKSEEKK